MKPGAKQAQAATLVMRGLSAHKGGQSAEAAKLWASAVSVDPHNKDALQLLGTHLRSQGDYAKATELLTRSLRIDSRQPHVHNNLANCLVALGQHHDALKHYQQALLQKPDYAECWFNRARAEEAIGDTASAEQSYNRCLQLSPHNISALINLSSLLTDRHRLTDAERLMEMGFRMVPAGSPAMAKLLNNLGLLRKAQGKPHSALNQFAAALAIQPDSPDITLNLANAQAACEKFDDAILCYRRVIQARPLDRNAHTNLNKLLWQLERDDELMASFAVARNAIGDSPAMLEMEAEARMGFGQLEQAFDRIAAAERKAPATPQVYSTKALILLRQNRPAEAVPVLKQALKAAPDQPVLLRSMGEALLRAGQVHDAIAVADTLSRVSPHDQHAVMYRQLGTRLLGDTADDGPEADINRFVHVSSLTVPPGFADLNAFNDALRSLLEQLHATTREPRDQTLRHGTQTVDSLFGKGEPLIGAFVDALRRAIKQWLSSLSADPAHPFLSRLSPEFRFTGSWSSRLHDKGFHTNHIHPAGWLSGVYYLDVPTCAEDTERKEGWLKFGQPNLGPEINLPWLQAVQPLPGRLVLFPSYLWHGTIPFTSIQQRLTVAFDLVPSG